MISVIRVCGRCGAKIPDDTTREVCPACLLETGLGLLPDEPVAADATCGPVGSIVIPSKFGDFEIARREDGSLWELGRGGMGVTYRARDSVLHRSVALKVIEVPHAAGHSEVARERFLREARAAAALRHPNVAAVYHFGASPGDSHCYYAMELVEGETLEARVRREGPLKVAQVLEIGAQVTRALIAAANQGLIHRDLKPGNIMLTRSEDSSAGFEVKVIDFGLAKITAESFGEMDLTHGGFVGTPSYASPEQFAGGRVDARSDIYSLGASLWFALTGHLPCAGTNVEEIRRCQAEAPLPVQQLVARKVAAPVKALLRSMLAIDPDERPASARELMEAIEECRLKLTDGKGTTRRSFFAELQRRNVYKVAIAYAVVAWLLMQIASQVFPFFEIPNWAVRLVVLLLIIGFPIALIIAWAFELTPEGLKRTEVADREPAIPSRNKAWIYVVGVAAALSVGLFFVGRYTAPNRHVTSGLPEKSIAVLPFENLSEEKGNAYFTEGIQEEILTRLSKIADLKVIARTSTQQFQSKPANLFEIAKQLGVANILEGSVQRSADQVRVNVQLTKAATGAHLWADTFDRKLTDIFAVESDIATTIAETLQAQLTGSEKKAIAKRPTPNAEAYELYLKGRFFWNKRTGADLRTAIDYFNQALGKDPSYALAYAGLADSYDLLPPYGAAPAADSFPQAKAAAKKALELDDTLGEAHTSLAGVLNGYDFDFEQSLKEFERAIQLNPNYATAHHWYGETLGSMGRLDEAIAESKRARELDPLSLVINTDLGEVYVWARQYDKAIEQLRKTIQMDPRFYYAHWTLGIALQLNGQLSEAIAEYRTAADLNDDPFVLALLGQAHARAGQREDAKKILARLTEEAKSRYVSAYSFALMYLALDDKERAIDELERAYRERAGGDVYRVKVDPMLDDLRGSPRFEALVQTVFASKNTEAESAEQLPGSAESLAKSIAVLPFENLSRDPDNAYFAQGIQEEILTRLASIADLRVISRTSTQQYQSKPPNLAEIAKQLGVVNILEGSVQKVGDQVRVNVQLVNAQNDSHLWAETYDRKFTDIFGVESEIAKRIAESLQAKLTGREEQALAIKPTNNPEAYDAYLRGLAFDARSAYSSDPLLKAIGFYERAVQLDPKFALAWARLSRAHAFVYFFPLDATSARRDAAKRALENAQKLQPNSPETLLALGYYQYHVLRDYRLAKTTFERVSKMLPGSSEVPYALAVVTRREGLWDQSVACFEQALALDPRNVELLMEAAWTHAMLRQFPAALKLYDRALDITPNDPEVIAAKASIYQAQGNLEEAAKLLSEVNERTPSQGAFITKITQLRLERNLGEAVRLLQARQAQFHFPSEIDKGVNHVWLAWTQRLNGDTAGAKVTAAQARNTLEPVCNAQPENAFFVAALSMANAVLGEKEEALKEAERAIMLLPSIKDRVWGPALEDNLALIQMMVGENSRAISTLTRLWQTPHFGWIYGYGRTPHTPALLRLDPLWDPLRADPAFQKLCEQKQP